MELKHIRRGMIIRLKLQEQKPERLRTLFFGMQALLDSELLGLVIVQQERGNSCV